MFRKIVPFLLFFAVPLHAKLIRIEPPAPTSETPVRVIIAGAWRDGCLPQFQRIDRSGPEITLQYATPRDVVCIQAITPWSDSETIGVLAPGVYRVSIVVDGTTVDSYDLSVADANPPLRVFPSAKAAGVIEQVQITSKATLATCEASGCTKPTVIFGGVVVPDQFVTVVDGHTLRVVTMPHDPGFADVTVKTGSNSVTASSVFRFFKLGAAPDPALFERILLPVVFNGFGAYSTWWRTDVNILNTNPVTFGSLDAARAFYFFNCVTQPPCPGSIPAGGNVSVFDALTKNSSGLVLMPQRDFAKGLRFGYRLWEMNQFAQGLSSGTELPVVREADFRTGKLNLVQVPLDHQSRIALRIYGPESEAMAARVRVYGAESLIAEREVMLQAPLCTTDPCGAGMPSFAIITDLEQAFPQVAQLDRVRIEVEATLGLWFWAFVTITNNNTQNVTLVTPQ